MMWTIWVGGRRCIGASCTSWLPIVQLFAGLLLGGSLSNAVESSLRGTVSDYVCLRFWPAFNLADLAVAAGAVGILHELLMRLLAAS